jgi:hypothetical protein
LLVLALLRRQWSLSGREGLGVLSPSRRACEAGFDAFRGNLIFHYAEGWNQRRSHGGDRRCFPSVRRWVAWRKMLPTAASDADVSIRPTCRAAVLRGCVVRHAGGVATDAGRQRLLPLTSAECGGGIASSARLMLGASGEGASGASDAAPRGFRPY